MKIAINTRFLLPGKMEGIGWFTYEVCKRLVQMHPEHEFIFLFDRKYSKEFVFEKHVRPLSVFPPARHPILFYWWFEWSLPRIFKKHQPDVFISTDNFASLAVDVPTLLVIHDVAYKDFPDMVSYSHRKHYEYFMPRYAHRANRITTVSEFAKQSIATHLQVPLDKIDVTYNGCNEAYKPFSEQEKEAVRTQYTGGAPFLLYSGSIHPRKNLPRMLRAFDLFKRRTNSPLKFALAGRMAWQTGAVGAALEQMEYQEDVLFLGYKGIDELPKITAAAFAMMYVSLFEGFGLPILESMQAEVPVITSNITSMPEVAGGAALLADPYSPSDISNKIQQLWENEPLRQAYINKGIQRRQQFSWDTTAKKTWESLERML